MKTLSSIYVAVNKCVSRCFGRTEKYPKPIAEQGLPSKYHSVPRIEVLPWVIAEDTPKVQPTGQKDLHP